MSNLIRVFTYGTLKRGEPNHKLLQSSVGIGKFIGVGKTVRQFPLVIASKYNIPFLLDDPGKGNNVYGEVFEVDKPMLKELDKLEDHPNFYMRSEEPIEMQTNENDKSLSKPETINCWVYLLKSFKTELLVKPYLTDYRSKGEHGLEYVDKYLRTSSYHAAQDVQNI